MTTGNEADPRDDALARAWRTQSEDLPPPALDDAILAAAHRAAGSGPRDAGKGAAEATRPQRWWMPLAAAATIGVVVIGILQVAPQAPVDIIVGERAEVAGRAAPAPAPHPAPVPAPAMAPPGAGATAKDPSPAAVASAPPMAKTQDADKTPLASSTVVPPTQSAPAPAPSTPPAAAPPREARKQVAELPAAPEPFPADKVSRKADEAMPLRQAERNDAVEAPRALPRVDQATAQRDAKLSAKPAAAPAPEAAVAPLKKESNAGAVVAAESAARLPAGAGARERDAARSEALSRPAPTAASSDFARDAASSAEMQARARDPDAWVARIRKLRDDGRVAEAAVELREFRRLVPDAETRLPADLRQWVPDR